MNTAIARLDQSCLFCGSPDVDMHHYREDNPSQGKGMGGHHDLDTLTLCREHHQGLHDKRWVLHVSNGVARGYNDWALQAAPPLFERPLVLDDSSSAPEFWSEQKLAAAYVGADMALMLWKGRMASVFHARKRYAGDWPELAAAAITRHTGEQENVSGRTVRRWANLFETTEKHFDGDSSWIDSVGRSVAYLLAESKDGPMSKLEEARECQDKGMSQKATVRQLTGRVDTIDNRCFVHCNKCGQEIEHRKRKEA